jgi:hypothetical protein
MRRLLLYAPPTAKAFGVPIDTDPRGLAILDE